MLDVMAYLNFPEIFATRTFVDNEPLDARNRQMMANRPLQALDGWILLSAVSADQIRDAVAAVGHPEWSAEILAATDGPQMTRRLVERVESQTRSLTVAECLARFDAHD